MYVYKCQDCGVEKQTNRRPEASYAPKRCRACNLEWNRYLLARLFNQPYLPKPERDVRMRKACGGM